MNIEEIKKEIEELRFNEQYIDDEKIDVCKLYKILDKYKSKDKELEKLKQENFNYAKQLFSRNVPVWLENKELLKYKNAWKELINPYKELYKLCKTEEEFIILGMSGVSALLERVNEIEQKHNIEVKK